jgi:hypothetical protein
VHPTLGMVSYPWRGVQVQRASAMHGLWLFQMAQSAVKAMPADARLPFDALMQRTAGQDVLALRLSRPLERRNNVLVLQ